MKKFFKFWIAAAIAVGSSCAFTSCGDDDDDENITNTTGSIVGTWELDVNASTISKDGVPQSVSASGVTGGQTFTFNADGTFAAADMKGTYSLNGHELTLTYSANGTTINIKPGEDIVAASMGQLGDMADMIDMEDMEEGMMSVIVNESNVSFNGNNQMIMTLTTTTTLDIDALFDGEDLEEMGGFAELFKQMATQLNGKTTQNLVYNRK